MGDHTERPRWRRTLAELEPWRSRCDTRGAGHIKGSGKRVFLSAEQQVRGGVKGKLQISPILVCVSLEILRKWSNFDHVLPPNPPNPGVLTL